MHPGLSSHQDSGELVNTVASQLEGPGFQFQLGQGFSLEIACSPWSMLGFPLGAPVSPPSVHVYEVNSLVSGLDQGAGLNLELVPRRCAMAGCCFSRIG